jgi:iron complex transport system permease protein
MADHHAPLKRGPALLIGLVALTPVCLIFAVMTGSVTTGWHDFWMAMTGTADATTRQVITELRVPRAASAFATGGMLALAGALMQVLLRNPLADPYILGVSGGAAVGTLGAMLAGITATLALTGSAFLGALTSMLLVFSLARGDGGWTPTRLLLTGVIVAAGWGAIISFMLAVSPDTQLRGMLFWLMGDLAYAENPGVALLVLTTGLLVCLPFARHLNVLSRGDLQASALGVNPQPLRLQIYVVASLLTAAAVTLAGSIGFVGLVVPHLVRLLIGNDQRFLLPGAVLLGGSLLVVADTFARTILAPDQLPVGVITAFLGVPVFLLLLRRGYR